MGMRRRRSGHAEGHCCVVFGRDIKDENDIMGLWLRVPPVPRPPRALDGPAVEEPCVVAARRGPDGGEPRLPGTPVMVLPDAAPSDPERDAANVEVLLGALAGVAFVIVGVPNGVVGPLPAPAVPTIFWMMYGRSSGPGSGGCVARCNGCRDVLCP